MKLESLNIKEWRNYAFENRKCFTFSNKGTWTTITPDGPVSAEKLGVIRMIAKLYGCEIIF